MVKARSRIPRGKLGLGSGNMGNYTVTGSSRTKITETTSTWTLLLLLFEFRLFRRFWNFDSFGFLISKRSSYPRLFTRLYWGNAKLTLLLLLRCDCSIWGHVGVSSSVSLWRMLFLLLPCFIIRTSETSGDWVLSLFKLSGYPMLGFTRVLYWLG